MESPPFDSEHSTSEMLRAVLTTGHGPSRGALAGNSSPSHFRTRPEAGERPL